MTLRKELELKLYFELSYDISVFKADWLLRLKMFEFDAVPAFLSAESFVIFIDNQANLRPFGWVWCVYNYKKFM